MHRRVLALAVVVLGPMALAGTARATPAVTGYPNSVAVVGDSISEGFDANGTLGGPEPQYSWATGTSSKVDSIYSRILAANPAISGNGFNDAATGAKMSDLAGQAATAVNQGAQEVLVLMGANDVCSSSQSTMTPVATFRKQLTSGLNTISRGLPDARIQVLSVPNIFRLWQVLHTNPSAQSIWGNQFDPDLPVDARQSHVHGACGRGAPRRGAQARQAVQPSARGRLCRRTFTAGSTAMPCSITRS